MRTFGIAWLSAGSNHGSALAHCVDISTIRFIRLSVDASDRGLIIMPEGLAVSEDAMETRASKPDIQCVISSDASQFDAV
jgi:hypothetical protein